jgi:hypothetical protein
MLVITVAAHSDICPYGRTYNPSNYLYIAEGSNNNQSSVEIIVVPSQLSNPPYWLCKFLNNIILGLEWYLNHMDPTVH